MFSIPPFHSVVALFMSLHLSCSVPCILVFFFIFPLGSVTFYCFIMPVDCVPLHFFILCLVLRVYITAVCHSPSLLLPTHTVTRLHLSSPLSCVQRLTGISSCVTDLFLCLTCPFIVSITSLRRDYTKSSPGKRSFHFYAYLYSFFLFPFHSTITGDV